MAHFKLTQPKTVGTPVKTLLFGMMFMVAIPSMIAQTSGTPTPEVAQFEPVDNRPGESGHGRFFLPHSRQGEHLSKGLFCEAVCVILHKFNNL